MKQSKIDKIQKLRRLTLIHKDKDYLTSILKMYKVDNIESLGIRRLNIAIKNVSKWNKQHSKKLNRLARKTKKKKPRKLPTKNTNRKQDYQKYLQSEHWLLTKKKYKKDTCFICNSTRFLELHHKNYKCLGKEKESDLVTLCDKHHDRVHNLAKNKKNILNIDTAVEYLKKKKGFI